MTTSTEPRARARGLGSLVLAAGMLAAAALSIRHLGVGQLPGCGLDDPCGRVTEGPWGRIPWLDWPLAFVGAAWFGGLLAAWWVAREGWPRVLLLGVRAGAVVSLLLSGGLIALGEPCPYCLFVHGANLVFLFLSERARKVTRDLRAVRAFAVGLVVVTLLSALARNWAEGARRSGDERALSESTAEAARGQERGLFTGRYRLGPPGAALRLVIFGDYQCPDCARLEREARELVSRRDDLSLSIKHFPLCKDCNAYARDLGQNPHPNACWAARAAEAGGLVAGEQGFWALHEWLLERGGSFRQDELLAGLVALGLEAGPFLEALHGTETLARVEADVREALALGLTHAPTVFLNGVELRGWRAPRAVERAVESLAAQHPSAALEQDRPPAALEKCLEDWRLEPELSLLPSARAGSSSTGEEPRVVVFGDYLDARTRELDRQVRAFASAHPGLRYAFRHFPLDAGCGAEVPDLHPGACRAARLVEAAFVLGGESAAGRLHARFIDQGVPGEPELSVLAAELALDPAALRDLAGDARTLSAVRLDVAAARAAGVQSIPLLVVSGRRVPRWRLPGEPLLERILLEASH